MPIDHQPASPPLIVSRLEPGPDGRYRVVPDPLDLGQEAEHTERQIRAGLGVPPTSFELPNVRADIREMARRHSRELRDVPEQGPRSEFPQMEIYSNPVIASGEDARRMRDYLRQYSARMERARQMVFGRSEPEAPEEQDPQFGDAYVMYEGPTVNIHRRFPLIERTVSRAQATVQRILGGLLARVRPRPEKPPEGPPRTRYERLKSDLPEL